MKITDYELSEVAPRWLFLRLETSDGTVGWGEPVVEGRARTVRAAVEELLDGHLLDEYPLRIEDHRRTTYHSGFSHWHNPVLATRRRERRGVVR